MPPESGSPPPSNPRFRVPRPVLLGCGGCAALPLIAAVIYLIWANWLPPEPRTTVSTAPLPRPNGYDAVHAALAKLHPTPRDSPIYQRSVSDPRILRPLLAEDAGTLQELCAALKLEYVAPAGVSMENRAADAEPIRDATHKLSATSRMLLAEGNSEAAERYALSALQLGSRVARGGGVVGDLIGCAVVATAAGPAEQPIHRLSLAQTEEAARLLDEMLPRFPHPAETLIQARREAHVMFRKLFRGEIPQNSFAANVPAPNSEIQGAFWFCYPKRWTLDSLDHSLAAMVRESAKPYPDQLHYPLPPEPLAREYLSIVVKYEPAARKREAELNIVRTEFALQEYFIRNHRLPWALNELVPRYLPSLPVDPFRGAPLTYRANERGYQLYSWGPDIRDDSMDEFVDPMSGPPAHDDIHAGKLGAPTSRGE